MFHPWSINWGDQSRFFSDNYLALFGESTYHILAESWFLPKKITLNFNENHKSFCETSNKVQY